MARGMAAAGHNVMVVSRALKRESTYKESDNLTIYRLLPRYSLSKLPILWRLNRFWEGYRLAVATKLEELIRAKGVAIIEAPALHGETSLFQFFHRSFPVVIRIHSSMPKNLDFSQMPNRMPLRMSHWHEKKAVARSQALSAPSRAIVEDNRPYLPLAKRSVEVIPNPIDLETFPQKRRATKNNTEVTVLYVGRLNVRKGAHILAGAMPSVWAKYPKAKFQFVGADGSGPNSEDSMRAWISKQTTESRRSQVSFVDHIPRRELPPLYQNSDIVVFPSLWEPFGYIALEAMASAIPLVATRSGGPQEIIEHQKDGYLVPVGSSEALSQAICDLIEDPALRTKIGEAAREKVLTKYATPVIVQQMEAFYQTVLDNRLG